MTFQIIETYFSKLDMVSYNRRGDRLREQEGVLAYRIFQNVNNLEKHVAIFEYNNRDEFKLFVAKMTPSPLEAKEVEMLKEYIEFEVKFLAKKNCHPSKSENFYSYDQVYSTLFDLEEFCSVMKNIHGLIDLEILPGFKNSQILNIVCGWESLESYKYFVAYKKSEVFSMFMPYPTEFGIYRKILEWKNPRN